MKIAYTLKALVAAVGLVASAASMATNFSFTGNFAHDNDVQTFTFTASGATTVRLISFGYGGGTQANSNVVARGGFDPILALFNSAGALVGQNDDSISATTGACGSGVVAADALTSQQWDTCLDLALGADTYTVSIMQYDNFANGPNLSNGFLRDGVANQNFRGGFVDVSGTVPGNQRDGHWAFDILNVETAVINPTPEPASLALVGLALAGIGLGRRARKA